ncbi:MAG: hypothetical protein U9N14_04190, partial [Pseudomonadota bacterium]|nr:hypothetical protein [Pseudomonadota bacterium]
KQAGPTARELLPPAADRIIAMKTRFVSVKRSEWHCRLIWLVQGYTFPVDGSAANEFSALTQSFHIPIMFSALRGR